MNWLRFIAYWLGTRSYRSATDEYRRTRTQLRRQRDRISPEAAATIAASLEQLRRVLLAAAPPARVRDAGQQLHTTAYACLEDPRRHRFRDAAEMTFSAVVVVLALRIFFLTPMVVPTGSMQPTLYGVTIENLLDQPEARIPTGWQRHVDRWVWGRSYYHLRAVAPGRLRAVEPPRPARNGWGALLRLREQRFQVGEAWYTVPVPRLELPAIEGLPPELLLLYHAGVNPDREYRTGNDLIKLALTAGDHVLIDRFTLNFRRPRRGEVIVFRALDIPRLRENAFYLKRLVAFAGETVQIGDDRHVRINGRRLDEQTPHFEAIYSFRGPPRDGVYSGHIHDGHGRQLRLKPGSLAPEFPSASAVHTVADGCVFVLGDNTVSSYDSRRFGGLPERAIVGRVLTAYWPMSERVGRWLN